MPTTTMFVIIVLLYF